MTAARAVLRVFIVEDNDDHAALIRSYLAPHVEVEEVGSARNRQEAAKEICQTGPNVLFLDIQLGGIENRMDGFKLLASLPVPKPLVVFVSGERYPQAAAEAQVDYYYLEKVVTAEAVLNALTWARKKWAERVQSDIIPVAVKEGLDMVRVADLLCVVATRSQTEWYVLGEVHPRIYSKRTHEAEFVLTPYGFERIGEDLVVKLDRISKVLPSKHEIMLRGRAEPVEINGTTATALRKRILQE